MGTMLLTGLEDFVGADALEWTGRVPTGEETVIGGGILSGEVTLIGEFSSTDVGVVFEAMVFCFRNGFSSFWRRG